MFRINQGLFNSKRALLCSVLKGEQASMPMVELNALLHTKMSDYLTDTSPKFSKNAFFYELLAQRKHSDMTFLNVLNIVFREENQRISLGSVSRVYAEAMNHDHTNIAALLELKFPRTLHLNLLFERDYDISDKEAECASLQWHLDLHNGVEHCFSEMEECCL